MLKAVGFDLDDTLYSRSAIYERTYQQMEDNIVATGIPFNQFEPIFEKYSQLEFQKFNCGEKTREQYSIDRVVETYSELGFEIQPEDGAYFNDVYHSEQANITLRPGVEECLSFLKSKQVIPFVLTNGSSEGQWKKAERLQLTECFSPEHIFVSGDLNCAKPDVEIFQYISQQLNVNLSEMAYIGDNYTMDVIGAQNAGVTPVWLQLKPTQEKIDTTTVTTISEFYDWLQANC